MLYVLLFSFWRSQVLLWDTRQPSMISEFWGRPSPPCLPSGVDSSVDHKHCAKMDGIWLLAIIAWRIACSSCWWDHRLSPKPSGNGPCIRQCKEPLKVYIRTPCCLCLLTFSCAWPYQTLPHSKLSRLDQLNFREYRSRGHSFITQWVVAISGFLTDFYQCKLKPQIIFS